MWACRVIFSVCVFFLAIPRLAAQETDSTGKKAKPLIAAVPLVFYAPETRWGVGATGTALFNWRSDTARARASSLNLGFAVTQNRQQFFVLPYHLFFINGLYQLYGELAYNRYKYNFYGAGNNVPEDYVERYGLEFPRVRVTFLRRFTRHFYAGPRVVFDSFSLFDLDPTGIFATDQVAGSDGGMVAGPAAVLVLDSRDQVYYPLRGTWTELVYFRNLSRSAGGPFTRVAFDHSRYLSWHPHKVLALNAYSIFSPDDLPFYQMGMLGGVKKMRGFYEGRYRDNNLILFQAEYRRWIKGIFGLTLFASAGQVARRYDLFHHHYWKYTYGAGLRVRLDRERRLNLRIDAAFGNGRLLPYFTVGEAF
jgi:hypothetical protein